MKNLKIKVVGCGGIGSWLIDPLCTMLNYSGIKSQVGLIDGDIYEEKNKTRQNFNAYGPKSTVTMKRLEGRFENIKLTDHPVYLTKENIKLHIKENTIVLLCVDNHKTRKLISDHAQTLKNVILVNGGNELTDGNIIIAIRKDGEDITLPLVNKYHPELKNPTDRNPGDKVLGCQALQVSAPQLVATNFAVAALMLNSMYLIVNNIENLKYNEVNVDIITNQAKSATRK